MLFNSIEFLVFLPIVFLIYWAVGYARINDALKLRLQNAFVVVASYVFYGWWDWRFLLLIALTSFCSWGSGLLIAKKKESDAEDLRGGAKRIIRKQILARSQYRAQLGHTRDIQVLRLFRT